MWVRGVAAALAAWCVSGVALAANYSEVWNPPEASGHVAKSSGKASTPASASGKKARADGRAKTVAQAGGKSGSHGKAKLAGKPAAKHVASGGHAGHSGSRVAANAGKGGNAGHAGKASAPDQVRKVTGQGGAAVNPNASRKKTKPALMVQSGKPHAHVAQAVPAHAKAANVAANPAMNTAAHTGATPARSGAANPVMAESNPATASSGSLPPILH